jgi:glutathione S-transferase
VPFGQIPVLEVDGEVIAQSTSIARFLAKEFNLAGKDHLEQAQADMVVDACNDVVESMVLIYREQDESRKKSLEEKFKSETFPTFLKNLENLLQSKGGKHFAGDSLTWADIAVAHLLSGLKDRIGGDILNGTKTLEAFVDDVINLPNIKNWIETRPKTDV